MNERKHKPVMVVSPEIADAFGMRGLPNTIVRGEAEHTPGPWTVKPGTSRFHVMAKNGRYIASGVDDREGESNARLIAAAPKMEDALQDVIDAVEYAGKSEAHKAAMHGMMLGILPKIRGILDEARGEK